MLIPNHPGDERLSALAARDDDAVADAALASHVSTCTRCTDLVTELGALRASLSELPDLAPSRPLQLLPPVADAPPTAGASGWVRRLFAPALTAGAAIAMVGLVGTAGPLVGGMASGPAGFQDSAANLEEADEEPAASSADLMRSQAAGGSETDGAAPGAEGFASGDDVDDGENRENAQPLASGSVPRDTSGRPNYEPDLGGDEGETLPTVRSIWPMVLFTGIALMVAAALLRWILVPRAG